MAQRTQLLCAPRDPCVHTPGAIPLTAAPALATYSIMAGAGAAVGDGGDGGVLADGQLLGGGMSDQAGMPATRCSKLRASFSPFGVADALCEDARTGQGGGRVGCADIVQQYGDGEGA